MQPNTTGRYFVHQRGAVSGPFDTGFIEAMVLSGVYPADVIVQKEGENRIAPLNVGLEPPRREASSKPHTSAAPTLQNTPWGQWVVVGVVILGLGAAFFGEGGRLRRAVPPVPNGSVSTPVRPYADANTTGPNPTASAKVFSNTSKPQPSVKTYTASPPNFSSSTVPPPPPTTIYHDSTGRVYRVQMSDHYRLQAQSSAIDLDKMALERYERDMDQLAGEIDRDRIYLDQTSQYQIDTFNAKVRRLNAMNSIAQQKVSASNTKVNSYNSELARVGTLIR